MKRILRYYVFAAVVFGCFIVARATFAASPTPVIVYSEQLTTTSFNLFQKIGAREPELLTTFTDIPQTPAYRLSYSKKLLALNFGNSIQIIDLKTKVLTTLLTTKGTFDSLEPPTAGVAITTDDKNILAIERTLGPNETAPGVKPDEQVTVETIAPTPTKYTYTIHYVNIKTGKDTVLRRATVKDVMIPRFFRTDGLALLLTPAGRLKLFDVEKKKFVQPKIDINTRLFAGDGMAMPTEEERGKGTCGSWPTKYSLVDYRTGKSFGYVKTDGNFVRMIAISPQKDAVLFSTSSVLDAEGKCSYGSTHYFVANLTTGEVAETKDYLSVMRTYDAWYVGAREGSTFVDDSLRYVINVNGEPVVTSKNTLTVTAQFWQQPSTKAKPKNEQNVTESLRR